MFLENLTFDAVDPQRSGRFWEQALGCSTLSDSPEGFETRLTVEGGPVLDLCFQPVATASTTQPRLHLDVFGGSAQGQVVDRLLGLGAQRADIGQGEVPWVVLTDPEGHPFCVMEDRAAYRDTGPIAAIPVLGGDPHENGAFWAHLSGWEVHDGLAPLSLRHPSGRGPLLEFFPTDQPKPAKNPLHLDLRLEAGDDEQAIVEWVHGHGGGDFEHDWGELPWRVLVDAAGNEFCILAARS